jgi:uncharacterized protein YciI
MMAFVVRLVPPRPSFALDMSPDERATMVEHVHYWTDLVGQGSALAFGPVADPSGSYGLGIILAEDLADAERLRDGDPALRSPHGFRSELVPMHQLVTASGVYAPTS